MAIRFPAVGSIVSGNLSATDRNTFTTAFKNMLTDAGWTSANIAAYTTVTFGGQPVDNNTFTCNGTTFTAKNTPTTNFHFQIGATYLDTASNMASQIAAHHPTYTASHNGAGVVTVTARTPGFAANGNSTNLSMSNATLLNSFAGNGFVWYGGAAITSVATETRLQVRLQMYYDDATANVKMSIGSADWLSNKQTQAIGTGAGVVYKGICTAHTYWVYSYNSTTGYWFGGNPYIREPQRGVLVSGAANNGSGAVRLTVTGHPYTTGMTVFVDGVKIGGEYSAAINGSRTVTVVNSNTVDLDGTTWPGGTYTGSTGVVANVNQIARAIYAFQGGGEAWRTSDRSMSTGNYSAVNEMSWTGTGSEPLRFMLPADNGGGVFPNFGEVYDVFEPRILWPLSGPSAVPVIVGDLFAAFVVGASVPMETTATYDGHDWVNFTHSATKTSLWLAVN